MATALPADTDLFDFIESLGKEEKDLTDTTISTPPPLDSNQESEHVNVWDDIAEALNNWTERILHVESRYNNKVANFRQTIEESLRRQQLDGFLNHHDVSELHYITDLWANLLQATSCYTVGCVFVKRDIITYLLELHTLGQINTNLFIETCLQL